MTTFLTIWLIASLPFSVICGKALKRNAERAGR